MSTYNDYYSDEIWPPTVKEEPQVKKEEKVIKKLYSQRGEDMVK